MQLDLFPESKDIENFFRFSAIYLFVLGILILDLIAVNIPHFPEIRPPLTLITLYYWCIYRPGLIPSWLTFLLGLSLDALSGFPIGLRALLFLVFQKTITEQRKVFIGQGFMTVFGGIAIVCSLFHGLQWMLMSALNGYFFSPVPTLISCLITIALYPPLTLLFNLMHRILPFEHQPLDGTITKNA